jgi:hypothetical protein
VRRVQREYKPRRGGAPKKRGHGLFMPVDKRKGAIRMTESPRDCILSSAFTA